jgi:hypothetical protein
VAFCMRLCALCARLCARIDPRCGPFRALRGSTVVRPWFEVLLFWLIAPVRYPRTAPALPWLTSHIIPPGHLFPLRVPLPYATGAMRYSSNVGVKVFSEVCLPLYGVLDPSPFPNPML